MMVSAHARAFVAFGNAAYREAAVRGLDFILKHFVQEEGLAMYHTWKAGRAQYDAFLDDYAYLIEAFLDVSEATLEPSYILQAGRYIEFVFREFLDPSDKMFYFTSANQKDVLLRRKDLFDSATPSGNSIMVRNLQRAGILLGRSDWQRHASAMLLAIRDSLERYPSSFGQWAGCLLGEVFGLAEVAVVGARAEELGLMIAADYHPQRVLMAAQLPDERYPLLAGKDSGPDTLVYLCQNYACQRPVESFEAYMQLIRSERSLI
jgi:hypothetical protein